MDGCSAVVHAAGLMSGDAAEMDLVNVRGTSRLLEAAMGVTPRLVYISSAGRYGATAGGLVDESCPPRPQSAYERTKALAEDQVLALNDGETISAASLQPSVILGSSRRGTLVTRLANAARIGLPLPASADGAILNAVDVSAVGRASACLVNASEKGPFIVSQPIEWSSVFEAIAAKLGHPVRRMPLIATQWLGRLGDRSGRIPFSTAGATALRSTTVFLADRATALLDFEPVAAAALVDRELQ